MKNGRLFTPGEKIYGFTVTRVRESKEAGGAFVEFVHDATGCELAFCDNNEENKLFCAAFKTLPEDSTGVFHILEHSVLCGSGKFPVKEPFVDLMKSSMSTFLNAMTYQDKTLYPVSSRNAKDFLNLTEVYLDAVFDPALLTNPNIFYQEGHHIEQDEEGNLSYKGVVFNEMKGALSDVDGVASEALITLLFPGSPYGVNSGGDPEHIPDLTYGQFVATYKKYYHPSNARLYVDGDIPFDETLKLIGSYLSRFQKGEAVPDPAFSAPATRKKTIRYELSENEPIENRGVFMTGRIIGTWKDKVKVMAAGVLLDVLLGSNFSPLKSRILESGLAQDVDYYTDGIVLQPYIALLARNVADGRYDELEKLIFDSAKEILKEGLDREQIIASITRFEFNTREQDEPRALRRVVKGLTSWLHGGDPLTYIENEKEFKELREMADNGGFEALMREIFEGVEGTASIVALPDYKEGERLREAENARLEEIKKSWIDAELKENAELNKALKTWQETPDTPEATAAIPVLDIREISPDPVRVPTDTAVVDGVKVMHHKLPTNGIVYVNLYFNISDFTLDELSVLSRAGLFYGQLPTGKIDALSLRREMKKKLGRFVIGPVSKRNISTREYCYAAVNVAFSSLESGFEDAVGLVREIIMNTSFDDTKRLREIALQNDESVKQIGINSGHMIGIGETLARYSAADAADESIVGLSMIKYSHRLADDFDNEVGKLRSVYEKMVSCLTRNRLTVSITSDALPDLTVLTRSFPEGSGAVSDKAYYSVSLPEKQGYPIPARIGFAVQGFNYEREGVKYRGSHSVAAQIVSLDYLWNMVRVRGGAYGAGIVVNGSGNIFTYSYRDPSPAATVGINRQIAAYLREIADSDEPIDKYIISTVAETEPLLSPRDLGSREDNNVFAGIDEAIARRIRREMLETKKSDLLEFCDIIDRFAEKGAVCVVAYKDALEKCEGLTLGEL